MAKLSEHQLYDISINISFPTFNLVMFDFFLMDYEFPPINVSQFYINVYLFITLYVNLLYTSRHILQDSNITVNLFIPPVCLIYDVPFLNFTCQTSQILTDIFYIFNFWTLDSQYKISYMNLPLIFCTLIIYNHYILLQHNIAHNEHSILQQVKLNCN